MEKLNPNGNESEINSFSRSTPVETVEYVEDEKSGITLGQIGHMIGKHWVAGVICLLVGLAGGVVYGKFIQTPKYQSSVDLMIVRSNDDSEANNISVARAQAQIAFKYLTTDEVYSKVGVKLSAMEGKGYDYYLKDSNGDKTDKINTSAVAKLYTVTLPTVTTSTTSVFVTVTSTAKNSTMAIDVANTVANASIELVKDSSSLGYGYLKDSLALMGEANTAKKTSTSTVVWAVVGALAGAVVGCAYGIIRELTNNKVSSKAELESLTGYKVIGMIPKYEASTAVTENTANKGEKDHE